MATSEAVSRAIDAIPRPDLDTSSTSSSPRDTDTTKDELLTPLQSRLSTSSLSLSPMTPMDDETSKESLLMDEEVVALRAEVVQLRMQLAGTNILTRKDDILEQEFQRDISALHFRIAECEASKNEVEKQLHELQEHNYYLQLQVTDRKKDLASFRGKSLELLRAEMASLKEVVGQKEETIAELQKQIRVVDINKESFRQAHDEEMEKLNQRLSHVESMFYARGRQLKQLAELMQSNQNQGQIYELRQCLQEQEEENRHLSMQISELERQCDEYRRVASGIHRYAKEIQESTSIESVQEELKNANEKIYSLAHELERIKKHGLFSPSKSSQRELETELVRVQQTYERSLDQLRQELIQERTAHLQQISVSSSSDKLNSDWRMEQAKLTNRIAELNDRNHSLEHEKESFAKAATDLENELTLLQERYDQLIQDRDQLVERMSALQADSASWSAVKNRIEKDVREKDILVLKKDAELIQLQNKLLEVENLSKEQKRRDELAMDNSAQLKAANVVMMKKIADLEAELIQRPEAVHSVDSRECAAQTDADGVCSTNLTTDSQVELAQLRAGKLQHEADYRQLANQIADLTKALEAAELSLESSTRQHRIEIDRFSSEADRLLSELRRKEVLVHELNQTLEDRKEEGTRYVEAVKSEWAKEQILKDELMDELKQNQALIADLRQELAVHVEKLHILHCDNEQKSDELIQMGVKLADLKQQNDLLHRGPGSEMCSTTTHPQGVQAVSVEIIEEIKDLKQQIAELTLELNQTTAGDKEKASEVNRLKNQVSELTQQAEKLRNELVESRFKFDVKSTECRVLEERINMLELQCQGMECDKEALLQNESVANEKIASLETELSSLRDELRRTEQQHSESKQTLLRETEEKVKLLEAGMQKEMLQWRQEFDSISIQYQQQNKTSLQTAVAEIETLESELKLFRERRESEQNKFTNAIQEQQFKYQQDLLQLESEVNRLTNQMKGQQLEFEQQLNQVKQAALEEKEREIDEFVKFAKEDKISEIQKQKQLWEKERANVEEERKRYFEKKIMFLETSFANALEEQKQILNEAKSTVYKLVSTETQTDMDVFDRAVHTLQSQEIDRLKSSLESVQLELTENERLWLNERLHLLEKIENFEDQLSVAVREAEEKVRVEMERKRFEEKDQLVAEHISAKVQEKVDRIKVRLESDHVERMKGLKGQWEQQKIRITDELTEEYEKKTKEKIAKQNRLHQTRIRQMKMQYEDQIKDLTETVERLQSEIIEFEKLSREESIQQRTKLDKVTTNVQSIKQCMFELTCMASEDIQARDIRWMDRSNEEFKRFSEAKDVLENECWKSAVKALKRILKRECNKCVQDNFRTIFGEDMSLPVRHDTADRHTYQTEEEEEEPEAAESTISSRVSVASSIQILVRDSLPSQFTMSADSIVHGRIDPLLKDMKAYCKQMYHNLLIQFREVFEPQLTCELSDRIRQDQQSLIDTFLRAKMKSVVADLSDLYIELSDESDIQRTTTTEQVSDDIENMYKTVMGQLRSLYSNIKSLSTSAQREYTNIVDSSSSQIDSLHHKLKNCEMERDTLKDQLKQSQQQSSQRLNDCAKCRRLTGELAQVMLQKIELENRRHESSQLICSTTNAKVDSTKEPVVRSSMANEPSRSFTNFAAILPKRSIPVSQRPETSFELVADSISLGSRHPTDHAGATSEVIHKSDPFDDFVASQISHHDSPAAASSSNLVWLPNTHGDTIISTTESSMIEPIAKPPAVSRIGREIPQDVADLLQQVQTILSPNPVNVDSIVAQPVTQFRTESSASSTLITRTRPAIDSRETEQQQPQQQHQQREEAEEEGKEEEEEDDDENLLLGKLRTDNEQQLHKIIDSAQRWSQRDPTSKGVRLSRVNGMIVSKISSGRTIQSTDGQIVAQTVAAGAQRITSRASTGPWSGKLVRVAPSR